VAIAGVGLIAALGKTVPTQLWDVITALSGALLGMLIPSPAQRRATKAQQQASVDPSVQAADTAVQAAGVEAMQTADKAKQAGDEADQAAAEADQAPEDAEKKQAADQAAQTARDQARLVQAAQAKQATAVQAKQMAAASATQKAAAAQPRTDGRIVIAVALALTAAVGAVWLYTGPGQDSQCLASVGTLTTTVLQPAPSTGTAPSTTSTTPSGGAPANTVTNVSTLTIGQIATPLPKSTSSGAEVPAGPPQILKTATGSSTKCPAVVTGDALLALALGVLTAILGILVPSFKLPETTETPTT
jgi:hypothetical protein